MKKLLALALTLSLALLLLASCAPFGIGTTTVNFETYGGGYYPPKTYQAGESITVTYTPYKHGYRFVGWCFDADLTESVPYSVPASSFTEATWYARYEIDTDVVVHTISLTGATTVDGVYAGHSYYILNKTSDTAISSIVLTPNGDPAGEPQSVELIRADGRPIADTNPDPAVYTPESDTSGLGDYVLVIHSNSLGYFTLTIND